MRFSLFVKRKSAKNPSFGENLRTKKALVKDIRESQFGFSYVNNWRMGSGSMQYMESICMGKLVCIES